MKKIFSVILLAIALLILKFSMLIFVPQKITEEKNLALLTVNHSLENNIESLDFINDNKINIRIVFVEKFKKIPPNDSNYSISYTQKDKTTYCLLELTQII